MGAVYLAEHIAMRKRVAMKLLHKEMTDNAEVAARFEREGFALARVEHPNVASATDSGVADDGTLFLVLEYVEGTPLREAVAQGRLAPARALHIARQIASALERAHDAGIVHRDLKPENVMLVQKADDPDFVKVLDFGIAKVAENVVPPGAQQNQPLTRLGTVLGTPEYMAPEQALAEPVTAASDLYALGVMLYEMLTGKHPFSPPDRMAMLSFHIVAPVPAMADRDPEGSVPAPIEAVVRKLLEKDHKARYASARALIDAMDQSAAESGIELRGSAVSLPKGGLAQIAPPSAPAPSWSAADAHAKTAFGNLETPPALPAEAPRGGGLLETLKRLPRGVLIALAAALPLGFVLVVVAFIVASKTTPAERAAQADGSAETPGNDLDSHANPALVDAVAAQGPEALEALEAKYPNDVPLKHRVAIEYANAGKGPQALKAVRVLLTADPKAGDDAIARIVETAAVAQQPEVADDAFAILEGPLGARGFDVLVDLSQKGPASAKQRAIRSVADPTIRAHASPAAAILLDLSAAKTCKDKKELLDRAKTDGDARLVTPLKKLKERGGCGFFRRNDCWSCLRKDDALDDALTALTEREAKSPQK
jgi:serine/threonine-protein kinase